MTATADAVLPVLERRLVVGPFSTRLLECGDPAAPPLVLLHDGAWGGCSSVSWSGIIARLAERYHVIAPDLLGYGGTDKAVFLDRSPYGFRLDHVAATLDVLGVREPVHVVGTSFGGSLALRSVGPGCRIRVRSVTSISGSGGPWRTQLAHDELADWDGTATDMARITRLMIDEGPDFDAHVRLRVRWASCPGHGPALRAPRLRAPAGVPAAVRDDDWLGDLDRSAVPTLLVHGSQDVLLEPYWTARIAEAVPGCRIHELDCKHSPNIDRVEPLLAALVPFLSSTD
jgi:pimeloyl-ACP methyl ester carboxylesterase